MTTEITTLLTGAALGIGAGLTPGPISMLILRETLTTGFKNGIKIAFAPIITDLPIVLISTLVLTQLAGFNWIIAAISLCGAVFLARMGLSGFKSTLMSKDSLPPEFRFKDALITGFLSPNPYVFWFTIGAPLVLSASQTHPFNAVMFIFGFFSTLIFVNICFAAVVDRATHVIHGRPFVWVIRGASVALFFFAFLTAREGVKRLYPEYFVESSPATQEPAIQAANQAGTDSAAVEHY